MAKIVGADKVSRRLKRMSRETAKAALRGLYLAGQEIELEAERSITAGSVSGANHVPSLPGQPPNADTRYLDSNIETTIEAQNPPTVHVTSHAPYSAFLEFGTSKMAERPFMRPAVAKKRPRIAKNVEIQVSKLNRKG